MNKNLKKIYKLASDSVPDDTETYEECLQIFCEKFAEYLVKDVTQFSNDAEKLFKYYGVKS